jgi:hypothetical protein
MRGKIGGQVVCFPMWTSRRECLMGIHYDVFVNW